MRTVFPALMPNYARADLAFERGEGAYLYTTDGQRFLDFSSGVAVTALGHSHPKLVKALTDQAQKLWHCSNLYRIPEQERLAERLIANCFADTVFFCNSGAEAVEAGLKICRRYHATNGHPERYRVISFDGSFHGRTLATISAGSSAAHRTGFGPPVEGFDHVAFGNLNEVRAAITPETAAILIEPVQGEGGIRAVNPDFMRGLRQACDEFGLLLMFDEVQCGMGRTGKLFAHQWTDVAPDVMSLAKGIGGGFPVGACLATEAAAAGMTPGSHGSTFGGNPLAMAAGNAVLDVMLEKGFFPRVQEMSKKLLAAASAVIEKHPAVLSDIHGVGMMLGLKAVVPNTEVTQALRNNHLLAVPAGDNNVRWLPPLIIDESHIAEAAEILEKTCRGLEG